MTLILVPRSWHLLGAYLHLTVPEFVRRAVSGLLHSKLQRWLVQLFKHVSHTGCQLVVLHDPPCCTLWTFSVESMKLTAYTEGPIQE